MNLTTDEARRSGLDYITPGHPSVYLPSVTYDDERHRVLSGTGFGHQHRHYYTRNVVNVPRVTKPPSAPDVDVRRTTTSFASGLGYGRRHPDYFYHVLQHCPYPKMAAPELTEEEKAFPANPHLPRPAPRTAPATRALASTVDLSRSTRTVAEEEADEKQYAAVSIGFGRTHSGYYPYLNRGPVRQIDTEARAALAADNERYAAASLGYNRATSARASYYGRGPVRRVNTP